MDRGITIRREPGNTERVVLATVWAVASVGLLYFVIRDATRFRAILAIDARSFALALAPIVASCIGGMAVAISLYARWRHARLVAIIVTYPLTFFGVWALAWCLVALLSSPGTETLGAVLASALALVTMHRTRKAARELGAGSSSRPPSSHDPA